MKVSRNWVARVLITSAAFIATSPLHAQSYYRWVDEFGTVHFSERPPEEHVDATQETLARDASNAHLLNAPETELDPNNEQPEPLATAASTQSRAQQNCTQVRTNLAALELNPSNTFTNERGETLVLDAQARQQQIEQAKKLEAEYCQ